MSMMCHAPETKSLLKQQIRDLEESQVLKEAAEVAEKISTPEAKKAYIESLFAKPGLTFGTKPIKTRDNPFGD